MSLTHYFVMQGFTWAISDRNDNVRIKNYDKVQYEKQMPRQETVI